jgi:hypothetical protein
MSYTLRQFGSELLAELDRGYEVVRLARWAYSRYLAHSRNLEEGLREKIMQVVVMEEGPEFEMSETELREFGLDLTT